MIALLVIYALAGTVIADLPGARTPGQVFGGVVFAALWLPFVLIAAFLASAWVVGEMLASLCGRDGD